MATKFQLQSRSLDHSDADVLVLLLREPHAQSPLLAQAESWLGGGVQNHLKSVEFAADKGQVVDLGMTFGKKSVRVIVVGVRTADGGDTARFSDEARTTEAAAVGVRTALGYRPRAIDVFDVDGDAQALGLGVALGAYRFEKYLTKKSPALAQVHVVRLAEVEAKDAKSFALGLRIADGVCMARDLINEPPNVLTPAEFARRARAVATKNKLVAKILNHQQLQKAGMHLHDAVGKGSDNEPYFIHLTYKPAHSKGKIAFVGKGLTFDSGGLCIKPAPGMGDMKSDMSGGAAVLGLMEIVSSLKLPVEVHGIIGAAENMPDARAYRPADVIVGLGGKGVEVINTDAEGRLVLADALVYAARLKPDFMIDAATLTGATLLSLSPSCSAYFTPVESLAQAMAECSSEAGESFWRMPLIEELAAQLKSNVTDLQHTGDRMGGAITAALFLREFTLGVPWVHLDIPGAVYRDRASGMHPKGGTGHAVLTFAKLIERHASAAIATGPAPAAAPAEKKRKSAPRGGAKTSGRRKAVKG
jgi:leucyl aminopeptidase